MNDKKPSSFKYELSIGNLLSIATVIVTGAIAWGVMTQRVSGTEAAVARIEHSLKEGDDRDYQTNNQLGRIDERVKSLETAVNKQTEVLQKQSDLLQQVIGKVK